MIFNEHDYFSKKIVLMDSQIKDLEELNSLYIAQDSVRCKEIEEYKNAYEDSFKKYNKLDKKYKTAKIISFSKILLLIGSLLW